MFANLAAHGEVGVTITLLPYLILVIIITLINCNLAAHGEVGVADEVHVDGRAGGCRGAVSERLEVGSSRRRALVVGVAGALEIRKC